MTLGEQLKKLRLERELSQPELSVLVGIEQSYLSKLENDKSLPSNEIFQQLLKALKLDIDSFLAKFDLPQSRAQLSQIPLIAQWFKQQQKTHGYNQRRYLYSCSALIVLAVTLFYAGFSTLIFTEIRYQYESVGVILPGEPKDIYNRYQQMINTTEDNVSQRMESKKVEMAKRRDQLNFLSPINHGKRFVMDVEGGIRDFHLDNEVEIPQPINAWLQLIGVLLFSAGMMGFFLERRLFKI